MPTAMKRADDRSPRVREKLFADTTLSEKFLLIAVMLSPFQKAFTIDLGFPFKASEIAIILAVAALFVSRKAGRGAAGIAVEKAMVGILAALVAASTAYNLLIPAPRGNLDGYAGDPARDMVTYLGYALMVIVAWWAFTGLNSEKIGRALGIALRLCVLACVLQFLLWQLGDISTLRLFRYELVTGSAYGGSFPRNGPFMEGNYLGFFGGIGLFIAAKNRDYIGAFCALFCALFSQSTNALLAIVVAAIATALIRPSLRWQSVVGFAALVLGAAMLIVPQLQQFLTFQLGKLGFSDGGGRAGVISQSISIRSDKSAWAFEMAFDHPLLGVGPGRFGLHFDDYAARASEADGGRALVESAYGQLAAEVGLIALLVFVVLLVSLAVKSLLRSAADFATVVFVSVALSAAPSWTTITIWIVLAYLTSAARIEPMSERPSALTVAASRGGIVPKARARLASGPASRSV